MKKAPHRAATLPPTRPLAWVLSACLFGLASPGVRGADVLVDSSADSLANDGACTLREALENTSARAQVWIDCPGDFGPDRISFQAGLGPIELGSALELEHPAELVGPPGGQEIRPAAGVADQLLRITPASGGTYLVENMVFEGARHAFFGTAGGCTNKGGAVCVHALFGDFDVVLRGVTFRDNRVVNLVPGSITGGGALFVNASPDATVRVEDSVFDNNRLTDDNGDAFSGYGGAILALSPLTVASSLFTSNLVASVPDGRGGAIHAFGDDLTITRSTFIANGASGPGAAVVASLANLLLLDSLFTSHAGSIDVLDFAGGLGDTHFLTIANTMFEDNLVRAITITERSQASISQSTIAGNEVEDGLAGLFARGATLTITGSTFADNASDDGGNGGAGTGAISIEDTTLVLEDSTLVGNDTFAAAGEGASGIEALDSQLTIRNTVLANTPFGEGNLWLRGSSVANMSHSLLTPPDAPGEVNGTSSDNVFVAVAAFGLLDDYGCAKPIGYLGDRCVSMRPHSSFATAIIDVGSSSKSYDQRGPGFPRDDGAGVDIGAYELQPPLVEFASAAVALPEGNAGTTAFSYTVRRNGDVRGTTQASWQVQGEGAAAADSGDFSGPTLPFGTAFFDVGEREATISLQVQGDAVVEGDEGFRVQLTQVLDGQPGDADSAAGTILNDDAAFPVPLLSLSALETDLPEGDFFYTAHRFRVTRTQDTSGFCSYVLDIAGHGADPIEQGDLFDRELGPTGTFQMGPGEVSADFEVRIAADAEFEGDEGFIVTLASSPSGCFINQAADEATSVVANDDSLFALQSVVAVEAEGDSGSTAFSFTVTRSGVVDKTASVGWSVSGAGGSPAGADDFAGGAFPSGQVSMAPGVVSVPLSILVAGDTSAEPDEDFRVQLGNPRSGGSIDPLADFRIGVIIDDDQGAGGDAIFGDGFED